MPQVGINQEPLRESLIFAFDGADYRVITCDTNGQILAAIATGQTLSVIQSDKTKLLATVDIATGQTLSVIQSDKTQLLATVDIAANQSVKSQLYGYNGSTFYKLPLLFGRTTKWDENLGGTATGTSWTKAISAIAANTLGVITFVSITNASRAMTNSYLYVIRASGAFFRLAMSMSVAVGVPLVCSATIILEAGDLLYAYCEGCQVGDIICAGFSGYKMTLNA